MTDVMTDRNQRMDNPGVRISRRRFVRLSGALGAGLVVAACSRSRAGRPAASSSNAGNAGPAPSVTGGEGQAVPGAATLPRRTMPTDVDAYLKIGPDGKVTLYTGKVEYGQGIQAGFAQLAAEELDVPFERITVLMGDTDQTPWDRGTSGSASTRITGPVIRQAAAEMHQWLLELGAARLGRTADQVRTENGAVIASDDASKTVAYAELAAGKASNRSTKGSAPLKDPAKYTVVGQSTPRVDLPAKVNGQMKYGYDATVPGIVYGKIVRPPSWGATLESIDFGKAREMPGVVGVFRDRDFAGLAAKRHEQAEAALAAVKATWVEKDSPYTSENIHDALKSTKDKGKPLGAAAGDVDEALARAAHKVSVTVRAPYVAHAPIEPMTALVHAQGDRAEVWTSTQVPFDCQDVVAGMLNLPREQVVVHPLMSGGAFGRKNLTDAVIETARLSKAIGHPVRVQWTRGEEFQWEHARPAILVELTAGSDDQGQLIAWDWATYATAYFPQGASTPTPSGADAAANVLDYYTIPNVRSIFYQGVAPLPPQFWRANGAPVNTLARESAIDELAELAGVDPISYRVKLLQNQPRMLAVTRAAVEKSGWTPGKGSTGQGFGIGLAFTDGTYVAEVARVAVDRTSGKVRVQHVDAAVDCGLVVNPTAAMRQIEGSIVMQGTSSTLNEQLTFAKGKVTNPTLRQYAPLGFLDAPSVDVAFIEDKHQPMQGIGEPAVGPVSAAISNAIYDAVGVRMRDLPFLPDKVLAALKAKGVA